MGPRRTDIILSATVAVALGLIIALAQTDADAAVQPLAYIFATGFGAVLLLRRSMPRTVVTLSVLGTFAYYSLELTPIGVALPVVAALYSLAEVGLTRLAIISGVIVVVVATAFRIRDDSLPLGRLLGAESLSTIALLAAAVALGYAVATHRRYAAGQAEVLRLQDERLSREADVRRQRERVEISRDLHDTIGHRLSVISLHANVGIEALVGSAADEAAEARTPAAVETRERDASVALERIRTEAAASLAELRSMVRLLRTEGEDTTMVLDLDGIDVLLERARTAGLRVTSRIDLSAGLLPAPVETVIVRIIQEGITNVLRHANARTVAVTIGLDGNEVLVSVVDDGDGDGDGGGDGDGDGDGGGDSRGFGLAGMRERVRLMGGRLATSARTGQGFRLEARVPRRLPE